MTKIGENGRKIWRPKASKLVQISETTQIGYPELEISENQLKLSIESLEKWPKLDDQNLETDWNGQKLVENWSIERVRKMQLNFLGGGGDGGGGGGGGGGRRRRSPEEAEGLSVSGFPPPALIIELNEFHIFIDQ